MRLLTVAFMLFAAFPYTQILPINAYTQPWVLLAGGGIFALSVFQWNKVPLLDRIALTGLALTGFLLFIANCHPYAEAQEYKYLLSFLTPLVLTVAAFHGMCRYPALVVRLLQVSLCIWLVVSIVQFALVPSFLTWMQGAWGEHAESIQASGRGVLGFAPEPTHHGFHVLVLAAALGLLDQSRRSTFLIAVAVFEALILAGSSSSLMVLAFAIAIWVTFFRPYMAIAGVVLAVCGVWALKTFEAELLEANVRAVNLLSEILSQPAAILSVDYSVNIRLGGMVSVLSDVAANGLWPRGLSYEAWGAAREEMLRSSPWLMDLSEVGPPSGFGQLLYQGGFFVLPFLAIILVRIWPQPHLSPLRKIALLAVPFVFLSQFYVSAPGFALVYAAAIHGRLRRGSVKRSVEMKAMPNAGIEVTGGSPVKV